MSESTGRADFWRPRPDDTVMEAPHAQEMVAYGAGAAATLTIAIPTFRRPQLIKETLGSVLAQTDLTEVRVIVVDNDPDSDGHVTLLAAMPELRGLDFRYYRNRTNIGLFGNWNACIALAETPWVTVLNDDDLLEPDFVATMRRVLAADPQIDGLVCSMREFDTRDIQDRVRPSSHREQIKNFLRFGFGDRIRLRPRALFYRNIGGSSLGLVARPEVFRAVGGYQRSEYPAADHILNVRLAARFKFVRLKRVLTRVRIEDNVSAKRDVMFDLLRQGREIQLALLASGDVPPWWDRFSPAFLRMVIDEWNARWHVDLSEREVREYTGVTMPVRTTLFTRIASLAMRAF